MDNKLSAYKYIINNKKTVGVLIFALILSMVMIYELYVLLMITGESIYPAMFEAPKRISFISVTGETLQVSTSDYESIEEAENAFAQKRDELVNDIKKMDGVEDAYYTQVLNTNYQSVFAGISIYFPLIEADKIEGYLNHMDAKLLEGRLPKESGEVLIDSVIMKNRKLKIGDYFMKDWFGESFRIVGSLESPCMASVGIPQGFSNSGWYITVLNDENHMDMTKVLEEHGYKLAEGDSVVDSLTLKKEYDNLVQTFDTATEVMYFVVAIFLAISVLIAYVSFMRNRVNEYCLYTSIGFSRGNIYGMIMKEMGIIFSVAYLIGIVCSIIGAWLINELVSTPMGLISKILYPESFFSIIALYVLLMGVLQIPIILSINGIKTIDLIED